MYVTTNLFLDSHLKCLQQILVVFIIINPYPLHTRKQNIMYFTYVYYTEHIEHSTTEHIPIQFNAYQFEIN